MASGLRSVSITPEEPIVLLGYGDRTEPFEHVAQDIHAKALAIEDGRGRRGVVVTADLVGFQAAVITESVSDRIRGETGLERSQLLFNASHSHTGPLVSLDPWSEANAIAHAPLSPDDRRKTIAYTEALQDKIVAVVRDGSLEAGARTAQLGQGTSALSNEPALAAGRPHRNGGQPPRQDRSVSSGALRTDTARQVSCIPLRLRLPQHDPHGCGHVISGDYAGFAQAYLEKRFLGAQAMFMSGCGADANPSPAGSMTLAERHGKTLGEEVARVAEQSLVAVQGDLGTAYETVELPLQELPKSEIEERARLPSAEAVTARQMLRVLESGERCRRNT